MAIFSGKDGRVDFGASTFGTAKSWTMDLAADAKQVAVFDSDWKTGLTGKYAGTGTVELALDSANDIYDVTNIGDDVTLALYESASRNWSVPAQITNISHSVQADGAEEVNYSISFQTDGAVTYPS